VSELITFFSIEEIVLCSLIVFVAAILQMSVGMGFGMLASPLIALVRPDIVPGTIMLIGFVVAFSGAWRERGAIIPIELVLGVGGRVIGSMTAFSLLLFLTDIDSFLVFFGLMMLIAVLISGSRLRIGFSNQNLFGLSILSGLMGTITAVGAPPMAVIYHDRPPQIVRPTLNAFFGAGSLLGLASLTASGWMSYEEVYAGLLLLPAMLVGIFASRYFRAVSSRWLSQVLLLLSGFASIVLVFQGLT